MNGGVVELDPLPDANRTRTQDHDARPVRLRPLVFRLVRGVVVRGRGRKLTGARIDDLVGRHKPRRHSAGADLGLPRAKQRRNLGIGESQPLGLRQGRFAAGQPLFARDDACDFGDEETIDPRLSHEIINAPAPAQRLGQREQAEVCGLGHHGGDLRLRPPCGVVQAQATHPKVEGSHRLQQRLGEGATDGHHFAGGLHLRPEPPVAGWKLVKRPARDLHHDVVQRGFERRLRQAGDPIGDLIQPEADRDLGGHPRDRIAGGLAGQRRRTRHPRVDLDHKIRVAGRIQRELDVASTRDPQPVDDMQRRCAQTLVIGVREGLRGGDYDAVACMDTHRIDILHIADGDDRPRAVADDLVLNLFPSLDAALDENLTDRTGQ